MNKNKKSILSNWGNGVTVGYGRLNKNKIHTGIDISSHKGKSLASNVIGKVIKEGYNSVLGNYFEVEDTNGYSHLYAKLEQVTVNVGETVEIGSSLGIMSDILHYEVRSHSNTIINPTSYIVY